MTRFGVCFLAMLALASGESRLADAAKKTDRAAVQDLLKQHADVNAPQVDGMTALHWAVHQDDIETAKLLIEAHADVKAANRYGVTPLSLACTNGNGPMVQLLLKAGADANDTLPGGETALMTAARTGKIEPVKALLAAGADPNAKESRYGQTVLMWAAAEGNTEVVEALLEKRADFRVRLGSGFTALLFAVREGQISVTKALLKAGADVNEAVKVGRPSGRKLATGPKNPSTGDTPLHIAVTNAHYDLATILLDAGADPNANATGLTVLHLISGIRHPGLGDNDPAPRGSGKMTSLEMVKQLVAHGANVNARMTRRVAVGMTGLNTMGATPFFLAARTGDAELMRTLAALGADPSLRNADDSTPLMAAAGLGTRSPGEDAGTETEVLEAMQVALDLGNDINAVDKNGETAMHGAAYKNIPAVVEFLASKGAKIEVWNQKNRHGWTPLIIAQGNRFGNFKPSPVTVAAITKVMTAAGVSPTSEPAAAGISAYAPASKP